MIEFDQVPAAIRKPGKYFEYNTRLAVRGLVADQEKLLVIGQRTAAGTVAAEVVTPVFSDSEAAVKFGRGSQIHRMVRAAFKAARTVDLTVIALDDAGAGVAASGTVTLAGPATGAGVLTLFVGADRIDLAVAATATADATAAALKAELDKLLDLPVSATVDAAVVTLTARNKGTVGNQIAVSAVSTAAGLTAAVVALANGAADPTLQDALDLAFPGDYDVVVTPYNTQTPLTTLRTHLETLAGPMEQRPGVGVAGVSGALADATTLAGQINSGFVGLAYLRGTKTWTPELASAFGAVAASETDPARPLNTLELKGVHIPTVDQRLSRTEQESLLWNGVTPIEIGPGERAQIVRAITTYTLDADGVPDPSLLDLTTPRTLAYCRRVMRARVTQRFARSKLNDRVVKALRTELLDVLYRLEGLEIVENVEANKDGLVVERDANDPNRVNAKIPVDVVNGLHVFAGRIDLIL